MTPEQEAELAAAEQAKQTQEAEAAAKAEAEAKAAEDAGKKGKLGDIFKKEGKKEPRVVPEAVLIEEKKARKEAERKLKELEEAGASKREISDSLKEIAEKYDVDPELVEAIAKKARQEAEAGIDTKIDSRMKPVEEEKQKEKIDALFEEHFAKTLEEMPEYKSVAMKSVIKALSLDPANANKTFPQIIEEAYGHLVKGKKSVEKVRPKDGGANVDIDFARAKTDPEYYREIMADPATKSEYNKDLAKRLKL